MHPRAHIALSYTLALLSFVVGFWPLALLGLLWCVGVGAPVAALFLGLVLDVAYGAPVGVLHALLLPYTALALLLSLLRVVLAAQLRQSAPYRL